MLPTEAQYKILHQLKYVDSCDKVTNYITSQYIKNQPHVLWGSKRSFNFITHYSL
jgi:hypothetical protein